MRNVKNSGVKSQSTIKSEGKLSIVIDVYNIAISYNFHACSAM